MSMMPLWILIFLRLLVSAEAFSNAEVPVPEFDFEPGVIKVAIPKTSPSMTLAAIHLTIGEPVPGTKAGRFNQDLREDGRFFRGDIISNWETGDTIYYWVYVIVDGLGYHRLNQNHIIRARSQIPSKGGSRPSRGGSGPFEVPTPQFHLSPYTVTVTVPALPGVSLAAVHFSLNTPVPGVQAGRYNQDLQRSGDAFVGVFNVPDWKPGDVIHYWVYVVHDGLGKHKLGQTFVIPNVDGAVPEPGPQEGPPAGTDSPPMSPLLPQKCGNRSTFDLLQALDGSTLRVHGGKPASDGEYPWQVQLLKLEGLGHSHLCGGIIISDRHVLTAAHCLTEVTERRLLVVVGQYDRRTADDPEQQTFGVQSMQKHSRYSTDRLVGYAHDIAVLLLRSVGGSGISFGDYVQPLCLPRGDEALNEHTACLVSGWGRQDESREFPDLLHGGVVPYVTPSYCSSEEVWGSLYNDTNQLCAGFTAGGADAVDACEGDSGGPLACQDSQGRWKATGIVSWGSPECKALPIYVGVYTRVSSYTEWIVKTIEYLCEGYFPCP